MFREQTETILNSYLLNVHEFESDQAQSVESVAHSGEDVDSLLDEFRSLSHHCESIRHRVVIRPFQEGHEAIRIVIDEVSHKFAMMRPTKLPVMLTNSIQVAKIKVKKVIKSFENAKFYLP